MEPHAQIPDAGPFAAPVNAFTALVEELQSAEAAGLTACELEDLLAERGREVQRQLLQDHLDLRAAAREERAARQDHPAVRGADGITRTRVETGHGRLLATLFGTVQVNRCAWRWPGAPNLCPADAALSLPARRCSRALARLAAVEAARGSFEAAHAAMTRRCGPVIGKRQIEQAVAGAACDIAAFYTARVPVPCTASTLLVQRMIGDRLDTTGARWGLQGAEAILTLRAVISNGDFDDYWRYHLAREHQRLYPGTAQGQYTLSA
jgi:hypothetical protein